MDGIKFENLEIRISEHGNSVKMEWIGLSEARNPGETLNPFLIDLKGQILDKTLLIDFTKLDFMNSSTIPPIVRFLKACSLSGITTKVNYSKDIEWHQMTFKPMETIFKSFENLSLVGI